MDDGKLIIRFEAGRIASIAVGAGLDKEYSRLFDAARKEHADRPSIESGIKVVVFGCFWIEAVCNDCLRTALQRSTLPMSGSVAIWDAVKRARILQKVAIIAGLVDTGTTANPGDELRPVFDIRNRLVHFSDREDIVSGPFAAEEFESKLKEIPEADIVQTLKGPLAQEMASSILRAAQWLDEVYEQLAPTERLELRDPLVQPDHGDAV